MSNEAIKGDTRAVEEMLKQTIIWHGGEAERMSIFSAGTLRSWIARGGSAVVYDPARDIHTLAGSIGNVLELDLCDSSRSDGWNFINADNRNTNSAYEIARSICHREPPHDARFASSVTDSRFRKTAAAGALAALIEVAQAEMTLVSPAALHTFAGKRSLGMMSEMEERWAVELVNPGGGWNITGMIKSPNLFGRVLDDLQFYLAPFVREYSIELYSTDKRQVNLRTLRTPGTILYVTPATEEGRKEYAPVVNAILAHALLDLVSEPEGAPILFLIPYKAEVSVPEFWNYTAVGRGRNIAMWIGFSDPEQMRQVEGEQANNYREELFYKELEIKTGAQADREYIGHEIISREKLHHAEDQLRSVLGRNSLLLMEGPRGGSKTELRAAVERLNASGNSSMVAIHTYEHPDWDMPLVLAAAADSREVAKQFLADGDEEALLTCEEGTMSREEFENLPDWDG